jgi:hypothetical protein
MTDAPPACRCVFAPSIAYIDPACMNPTHRQIAQHAKPVWPTPASLAREPQEVKEAL